MPLGLAWLGAVSWKNLLLKLLPYLLAVAAVLGTGWYVYHLGSQSGAADIQSKWDKEKLAQQVELEKLRVEIHTKEQAHQQQTQRINDDLAEANQKFAADVARISAEYGQRLFNSEQRATRYQRMSSSGPIEQANLASHAAELDRSLEQGRQLVQELSTTLRQRDAQLRALGQQILTDRALIGEKDGQ